MIKVWCWWLRIKHFIVQFGQHMVRQATVQSTDRSGHAKYEHQWKWLDITAANKSNNVTAWEDKLHASQMLHYSCRIFYTSKLSVTLLLYFRLTLQILKTNVIWNLHQNLSPKSCITPKNISWGNGDTVSRLQAEQAITNGQMGKSIQPPTNPHPPKKKKKTHTHTPVTKTIKKKK
jgi:hypothetical protein